MNAPGATARMHAELPEELHALRIFLCWQRQPKPGSPGKFDKVPHYVNGRQRCGANGSLQDRAQLAELGDALAACRQHQFAGIGMALLSDVALWALDLDGCIFANGQLSALAQRVVLCGTYTERSPSGRGVRAIYAGKAGRDGKNHGRGVEIFDSRGFVTLTGDRIGGAAILPCPQELLSEFLAIVQPRTTVNVPPVTVTAGAAEKPRSSDARIPQRVRERLADPYGGGADRSAVAYSIALQLSRAGISSHEALELMSVPQVLAPALERRGGDIESARSWMWNYVVLPAYRGTVAA